MEVLILSIDQFDRLTYCIIRVIHVEEHLFYHFVVLKFVYDLNMLKFSKTSIALELRSLCRHVLGVVFCFLFFVVFFFGRGGVDVFK
uniref:Uncharacterized protein n=1 Tax=Pinctada fucata TaxID=50426 RepID=A0A194AN08_PINFU